jgi:hypothetical protein
MSFSPEASRPADDIAQTSSLMIVAPGQRQPLPEKHPVRQVQFVSSEPIASAPVEQHSSITIEPISTVASEPAAAAAIEAAADPARPVERAQAVAQRQPLTRPASAWPATAAMAPIHPQFANAMRQPMPATGANPARTTLSQVPRRPAARPSAPSIARQQTKAFQAMQTAPTVSPYLNLYRQENDAEGAPNYFAFVRPQVEQLEANREQQLEIQRLQRQVQTASPTAAAPQSRGGTMAETGTAARFMDTAQFYSAWQR